MSPDLVFREFAEAESHLPRAALQWSLDHWSEIAPRFLERLQAFADGTDRSQETADVLFFVVHLIGEARERRAFRALARICMDGSEMERIIGEGVTETLTGILIGAYDGTVETLQAVIEAEDADEFVRDSAIEAYSYLAAAGHVGLDDARAYLAKLYGTLRPQAESHVWVGWQQAVVRLGFADLRDQVAEAFRREFISLGFMDYHDFEADLETSLASGSPLEVFARERVGPITGIIEELGHWHGFSDEYRESKLRSAQGAEKDDWGYRAPALTLPHVNPVRDVGRNDPCPCGSGKKFKKCCLAA